MTKEEAPMLKDRILRAAIIFCLVAVGFAAIFFAVSWRQHNPPCPNRGESTHVSWSCFPSQ